MKKVSCLFADINSDFCCAIALHEKESFDECYECALEMVNDIHAFVLQLIEDRKNV